MHGLTESLDGRGFEPSSDARCAGGMIGPVRTGVVGGVCAMASPDQIENASSAVAVNVSHAVFLSACQ